MQKLHGKLMLNFDKSLIQRDANGNPYIWVDVIAKKQIDQYGNSHTITTYDRANKRTVYLSNLRTEEANFGGTTQAAPAPAPAPAPQAGYQAPMGQQVPAQNVGGDPNDDLPF